MKRQTAPLAVMLIALSLLQGCGGLSSVDANQEAAGALPSLWAPADTRQHIQAFSSPEAASRGTATPGLAYAAAYAAERMRQYGLQPVLSGSYRHLYYAPIHHVSDMRVLSFARDTLSVSTGPAGVPDGRSSPGFVEADSVWWMSDPAAVTERRSNIVALNVEDASDEALYRLRDLGVEGVLIVGPLAARRAATPIDDLLIVRLISLATMRVLRLKPDELDWSHDRMIPVRVRLAVASQSDPTAAAVNVAGYIPGRNPLLRSELVIVAAPLDGPGAPGGVWLPESDDGTLAPAAALAVARSLSAAATRGRGPKRTVMVALVSGGRQGDSGWSAIAHHPPWAASAVTSVLLLQNECPERIGRLPAPECLSVPSAVGTRALADSAQALARRVYDRLLTTALVDSALTSLPR